MKDFLSSMLADGVNGEVSSKRVVTFIAFLLCAIGFLSNLFFGFKIDQFIFDFICNLRFPCPFINCFKNMYQS